jgi:hypothetical protein
MRPFGWRCPQEEARGGQGFGDKGIESCPRQVTAFEGLGQRVFIHQSTASRVNQNGPRAHASQRLAIDHLPCGRGAGEMQADDIRGGPQLVEGTEPDMVGHGELPISVGIVGNDLEFESLGPRDNGFPDAPQADEAQRSTGQPGQIVPSPTPVADSLIALRKSQIWQTDQLGGLPGRSFLTYPFSPTRCTTPACPRPPPASVPA